MLTSDATYTLKG